jgi:hypothetical protein
LGLGRGIPCRLCGLDSRASAKAWCSHMEESRLRRVSAQVCSEGRRSGELMTTIGQVEFCPSLLSIRDETLQSLGHPVVSALGSQAARNFSLSDASVGVVVIGHGAPRQERLELIAHFRETLPGVPIVVLLRRRDKAFECSDFNCPADNPLLWVRMVNQALTGVG